MSTSYEVQAARQAVAYCRARLDFLTDRRDLTNRYAIEHARQNLQTALERLAAAEWAERIDKE